MNLKYRVPYYHVNNYFINREGIPYYYYYINFRPRGLSNFRSSLMLKFIWHKNVGKITNRPLGIKIKRTL